MAFDTLQEIERAIGGLTPQQLAELYAWIDRKRSTIPAGAEPASVFEQGLGLFGSPEDTALLDEVVKHAYEERRRPIAPSSVL